MEKALSLAAAEGKVGASVGGNHIFENLMKRSRLRKDDLEEAPTGVLQSVLEVETFAQPKSNKRKQFNEPSRFKPLDLKKLAKGHASEILQKRRSSLSSFDKQSSEAPKNKRSEEED